MQHFESPSFSLGGTERMLKHVAMHSAQILLGIILGHMVIEECRVRGLQAA